MLPATAICSKSTPPLAATICFPFCRYAICHRNSTAICVIAQSCAPKCSSAEEGKRGKRGPLYARISSLRRCKYLPILTQRDLDILKSAFPVHRGQTICIAKRARTGSAITRPYTQQLETVAVQSLLYPGEMATCKTAPAWVSTKPALLAMSEDVGAKAFASQSDGAPWRLRIGKVPMKSLLISTCGGTVRPIVPSHAAQGHLPVCHTYLVHPATICVDNVPHAFRRIVFADTTSIPEVESGERRMMWASCEV